MKPGDVGRIARTSEGYGVKKDIIVKIMEVKRGCIVINYLGKYMEVPKSFFHHCKAPYRTTFQLHNKKMVVTGFNKRKK